MVSANVEVAIRAQEHLMFVIAGRVNVEAQEDPVQKHPEDLYVQRPTCFPRQLRPEMQMLCVM